MRDQLLNRLQLIKADIESFGDDLIENTNAYNKIGANVEDTIYMLGRITMAVDTCFSMFESLILEVNDDMDASDE